MRIISLVFCALFVTAQANNAAAEDLSAISDAIREADDASMMYAVFLFICENTLYNDHRLLWTSHRDLLISGLTDLWSTNDRALVRFAELRNFSDDQEPITDTGMCLNALDQLQTELDIALAQMHVAVSEN